MPGLLLSPSNPKCLNLERRAFLDLLRMANTLTEPVEIARQLVVVVRYISRCEAVAIRLKAGPGYPYAAVLGFPENLIRQKDHLCATDESGHLLRDDQWQPIPACLCGWVLLGRVDRTQTCFSDRGSFITASTGELLASPAGALIPERIRNRCHFAGYETVGLFPIRRDNVTYGLIQCNDRQPGRLGVEAIDLLENLAVSAAHLLQLAMA